MNAEPAKPSFARSLVTPLVIVLVLAAIIWAGWNALERCLTVDRSYGVRATFEVLPADDEALTAMLWKLANMYAFSCMREGHGCPTPKTTLNINVALS